MIVAENLRCEYLTNPLAVGTAKPRLSWEVRENDPAARARPAVFLIQCSREAGLLAEGRPDLWDSGPLPPDEQEVVYGGRPIGGLTEVFWRVAVRDESGSPPAWSETARFGTGFLGGRKWRGRWIAAGVDAPATVCYFHRTFTRPSRPRRAVLYASSLGVYGIYVNGQAPDRRVLAPEWTDYHKRVQYQAYDVTALVGPGRNAIAAVVGPGWYAGTIGLYWIDPACPGQSVYGATTALLAELHLEEEDGRRSRIVSDRRWKCTGDGPILSSDLIHGELCDGRKSWQGWPGPTFTPRGWRAAVELPPVPGTLVPQPNEPVTVGEILLPQSIGEPVAGVYVADFGQNVTGTVRIALREPADRVVTIRHGERLTAGGGLYTQNLRSARQEDRYIARGGGERYRPSFTCHGFQYAEIQGLSAPPRAEDLEALAFWSAAPETGQFACSNDMLNRLHQNIVWTLRDNLTGIPTDCPQRDERLGWCGDIQRFSQTACYIMDMAAFFTKWLADLADDQAADGRFPDFAPHPFGREERFSGATGWADAGVEIPYRMYLNYADRRIVAAMFDPARRWVEWLRGQTADGVYRRTGPGNEYGDWLNADTFAIDRFPKGRAAVPIDVFGTVHLYRSASQLSAMALALGRRRDEREYRRLADAVRAAFSAAFVKADGTIAGDTQAGYALALHYGLLDEPAERLAFAHLLRCLEEFDGKPSTGLHSTVPLLKELCRFGRPDLAYAILVAEDFPSWGYQIRHGATTIWERWDGWTEERGFQDWNMNSFCHYAFGAVGEFLYDHMLGIRPRAETPGYREFDVCPVPGGGITWARGSYRSRRGPIGVSWTHENGRFRLEVVAPPGSTAFVSMPSDDDGAVRAEGATMVQPAAGQPGVPGSRPRPVYRADRGRSVFTAPLRR